MERAYLVEKPLQQKAGDCLGETDRGPRAGQGRAAGPVICESLLDKVIGYGGSKE